MVPDTADVLPFYYPTTVVIVSKNKKYVEALSAYLNEKNIPTVAFADQNIAQAYLQERKNNELAKNCATIEHAYNGFDTHYDLSKLHKHILNSERHSEVSVVLNKSY